MIIYIYALVDPRDNHIFYVGQTQNLKQRMGFHISESNRGWASTWPKSIRIREIITAGLSPLMTVLEETPVEQATDRETFWFDTFKQAGAQLANRQRPGWVHRNYNDGHAEGKIRVGDRYYLPLQTEDYPDGSKRFLVTTPYGLRRVFIQHPDGTYTLGKKTREELLEEGKKVR